MLPNRKVAITTPDTLDYLEFQRVKDVVREWLDGDQDVLVIGNCQVVVANVVE